jgi:hypothetical protein
MHGSQIMKHTLCSRALRGAAFALAAIAMVLATTAANAGCGDPRGAKSMVFPQMPFLAQHNSGGPVNNSIVGLWHVTFVSGGQVYYEAFKTWHSDGTEWENANLTPIQGNICVGAWETTKQGVVQLYHVGWLFDAYGNLNGTYVSTETNVVARDGKTYQGTFDDKFYDLNGNLVGDVSGTQTATRITPN